MNYEDLKDGLKVEVYIPSMHNFYSMQVYDYDGKGAYCISNYGCSKTKRIGGHEYAFVVKNQDDLDKTFYVHKGPLKLSELAEVTDKAVKQAKENKKTWIF